VIGCPGDYFIVENFQEPQVYHKVIVDVITEVDSDSKATEYRIGSLYQSPYIKGNLKIKTETIDMSIDGQISAISLTLLDYFKCLPALCLLN
jgi:hypothetical protein